MKFIRIKITLFILFVSLTYSSEKEEIYQLLNKPDSNIIKYPLIDKITIPNSNIDIYFLKNNTLPKVSLNIHIHGGVAEEPSNLKGITALWGQSILYSGSIQYPRDLFAKVLEQKAVDINFVSSLERSSFTINCLSNNINEYLALFLQIINNPLFAKEDIIFLKKQILQSISKRDEKPSQMVKLGMQSIYWHNNVRGNISTTDSINEITDEQIKIWHQKIWQTKRISISIAGDFNIDSIKNIISSNLPPNNTNENYQTNLNNLLTITNTIKPSEINTAYLISKDIPQTYLLWQAQGIKHTDKDYFAVKMFDFLLGGDVFNSILMREIRIKEGLTYGISSSLNAHLYSGEISIISPTQNKNISKLIYLVENILKQPESFVHESALINAKKSIKSKFIFLYNNPASYLNLKLSLIWNNLPDNYLETFLQNIDNIKIDEVINVGKKYYNPNNFYLVLVGPKNIEIPNKKIIKIEIPK